MVERQSIAPELIAAAARGDREARAKLIEHSLPPLRRFVKRRMGPLLRSLETSSDLAQSVCAEILDELSSFRGNDPAGFRRWLLAHAEHKILKRARFHGQQKRDARRSVPFDGDVANRATEASLTPSHDAVATEEWLRFRQALEVLPPDYREVIVLSRIVGLTPEQVAQRMGRSREAIWSLLSRALAKLAIATETPDDEKSR